MKKIFNVGLLVALVFVLASCNKVYAPGPSPAPVPFPSPGMGYDTAGAGAAIKAEVETTPEVGVSENPITGSDNSLILTEESDSSVSDDSLIEENEEFFEAPPEFDYFKGVVEEIVDSRSTEWNLAPAEFLMVVKGEEVDGYAPIIHAMGDYINTFIDKTHLGIPQVGDEVVVFFRGDLPMTMIYPPQHRALAIVKDNGLDIVVSRFDAESVNAEGTYRINITDDLLVLGEDGLPFELNSDLITNRAVIAFYADATRSIPAMINPDYIIVLGDYIDTPPTELDEIEFLWDIAE